MKPWAVDSVSIAPSSAQQPRPRLSPSQSLAAFKHSDSQCLVLPFLALFLFPPPHTTTVTLACLHTPTPPPSFRDPNVLGNGISWSLLIVIGCFRPSPTHTFPPPSLVRSLEEKQKRPCSLQGPLSSPSLPPLPYSPALATSVHSALSRAENPG